MGRFAKTIFSATQPCNIVLNSHNIVPTLQRCTVKHYDPTTATSMKTSLKDTLCILSFFFCDHPKLPSDSKRREFRLEMKRGERDQVQTEMIEFIGLPFQFSSKHKIWSFHVVVVQGRQRNVQKSVMHVQTCFHLTNQSARFTFVKL